MNPNDRNNKGVVPGVRVLGTLMAIGLCCIAMAPAVAANPTWVLSSSVLANKSQMTTLNGTPINNNYFAGIITSSHFNTTSPYKRYTAYNWSMDSKYTDRYYMTQLRKTTYWYPGYDDYLSKPNWSWVFTNNLTCNAVVYKKQLTGWVNASDTYYLWYGNKTAASYTPNTPNSTTGMLCPTVQNATYLVNLTVTCDDC